MKIDQGAVISENWLACEWQKRKKASVGKIYAGNAPPPPSSDDCVKGATVGGPPLSGAGTPPESPESDRRKKQLSTNYNVVTKL
jgi:hypothetical protein